MTRSEEIPESWFCLTFPAFCGRYNQEGAIFPGAQRGRLSNTHPERISVFFYARDTGGPARLPCAGCNRGQVLGDHSSDIELARTGGPKLYDARKDFYYA